MSKAHIIFFIVVFPFFQACQTTNEDEKHEDRMSNVVRPDFQAILDSANVNGTILLFRIADSTYFANNFDAWEEGSLPASTFKITNTLVGLETGVIENKDQMFKWNGEPRRLAMWERDMNLTQAFHLSCVPCYQEVARNIGSQRMTDFLTKMNYGDMVVSDSTIDVFWLEGNSKISPKQQIDFLKRLHQYRLPLSKATQQLVLDIMLLEERETYTLRGKTGWSIRNGNNRGWFVGSLEKADDLYLFATRIRPNEDFNMDNFPKVRKEITTKALAAMGLLE